MIQIAAGRKEDCTRVEVEFTQVSVLIVGKQREIGLTHNPTVTTAEDELSLAESPKCEDPRPSLARITYGDV